jgi:hypothetical protein
MSNNNTEKTNRRAAIGTIAGFAALFSPEAKAKDKTNPFHTKERDAERKRAQSIRYDRDVGKLEALIKEAYYDPNFPLNLITIDTDDKAWSDEKTIDQTAHSKLAKLLDNDPEKIKRHHSHVVRTIQSMQSALHLSVVFCAFEHARQFDKVLILNPLKSRKFHHNYNYGDGFVAQDALDWGLKDNTNASVYQAFYDLSAVGQCIDNRYSLDGTNKDTPGAELYLKRNQFADAFATLMLAKQFHTTYPASVIASRRAVRMLLTAENSHRFSDMAESIPHAMPMFTTTAIQAAIEKADALLKSDTIDVMTPRELAVLAEEIVNQPTVKMGIPEIQTFSRKLQRARNKMMVLEKDRIEVTLHDASILNPQNPNERAIINAYPFLFDDFRAPATPSSPKL